MSVKEIVERACAAYQAGDMDTVLSLMVDDIKYHNNACPHAAPHCARADNKAEFVAYITEIVTAWQIDRFELKHIVVDGSHAATRTDFEYVNKSTGKRVVTEGAHFWTIEDGKITEIFEFYDSAAIAAAMS